MRKKKKDLGKSKNDKDYRGQTVAELKKTIRKYNALVNKRIDEYILSTLRNKKNKSEVFEKSIKIIQRQAGVKGKKGKFSVGLGLSNKSKLRLQIQLGGLIAFLAKDTITKAGKRKQTEAKKKSYEEFKKRYGQDVSEEEWEDFYTEMDAIKGLLSDYGYEDYGTAIAKQYGELGSKNRFRMVDITKTARNMVKKNGMIKTSKNLIDMVSRLVNVINLADEHGYHVTLAEAERMAQDVYDNDLTSEEVLEKYFKKG